MKDEISRRTASSLMGVAALGLALPATLLTATDAEAQTVGMDRRQDRRTGRRDRRDARRTGRQERRDVRAAIPPPQPPPRLRRQRRHGTE